MITELQELFLKGLKDYCHNVYSQDDLYPVENGSVEMLYREAQAQTLQNIVYQQFSKCLPEIKKYPPFVFSVFSTYGYFFGLEKRLKSIQELLKAHGIKNVLFKGAVIRDYYPERMQRAMGDIDILIHPKDRDAVKSIFMNELHYQIHIDNHDVWSYLDGTFCFEVHTHMFYDPLANDFDYRSYFEQIWDHIHRAPVFGFESENMYVPDASFHFLYLMAHTAKHIINKGVGFRAYLDMFMICKACENAENRHNKLDWDWITNELDRLHLLTFTKICFSLCEKWFDVAMPLEKEPLEESFYTFITEKTFNDGIFGLENEENQDGWAAREIKRNEETGGSYSRGTLEILIKKLFPSYRDMQLVPWYKFVDGRPWLLPVAWIYRWGYCLKHKYLQSWKILTEPFTKKREIEKRKQMLKNWGL